MITIEAPRGMDRLAESGLSRAPLLRYLRIARAAVGLDGEVHVLLADDATLRRLNRQFRGKDNPTDVLSFPASASTTFFVERELAGDLAISLETAARQARHFGHKLSDEVRVLILHGLLHLAGLDHEQDSGQMAAREAELRSELGLPGGLIERVQRPPVSRTVRTAAATGPASGSFGFGSRKTRTSAQDDGIGGGPRKKVRA